MRTKEQVAAMAATLRTKKAIQAWCDANGVELLIQHCAFGVTHIHLNIDAAHMIFRAHDLHNLAVWNSNDKPDWKEIGAEIAKSGFGTCEDPDCDYCKEEQA